LPADGSVVGARLGQGRRFLPPLSLSAQFRYQHVKSNLIFCPIDGQDVVVRRVKPKITADQIDDIPQFRLVIIWSRQQQPHHNPLHYHETQQRQASNRGSRSLRIAVETIPSVAFCPFRPVHNQFVSASSPNKRPIPQLNCPDLLQQQSGRRNGNDSTLSLYLYIGISLYSRCFAGRFIVLILNPSDHF
jgi:hypothetical protein